MSSKKCCIEGCRRPVDARGMCSTHYMQKRRAGLLPIGNRARGSLEERFWRFVEKTDCCWKWIGGSVNAKGYGQIQTGGKGSKHITAHRLSYQIHKGEIAEGMVVMHSCDNPWCVNPDHLSLGTQSENILDAIAKGRKRLPTLPHHVGKDHPSAKLTEDNVRRIRTSGVPLKELAIEFGVAYSTVRRIKAGVSWSHIK